MSDTSHDEQAVTTKLPETRGVLAIRRGPGANCSSIGSAVEMLFLSASVGATVLALVTAALHPHRVEARKPPERTDR